MSVFSEVNGALVLVVDDNETTRYLFRRWLRRAGFEVMEAITGADAFALLAERRPDLAVLDVNLPDMSGFDVLEHIKTIDPSIPVLHVSATAIEVSDRSEGLTRGADAYLIEPVEPEELVATGMALLRLSAARRAAERLANQLVDLHDGVIVMHDATTIDQLAEVGALAAARILRRRLALVATADRVGTIAVADPGALLGSARFRPGQFQEAGNPQTDAFAGQVTSMHFDPLIAPKDLQALLAPIAGQHVESIMTRHTRGAGVGAVLVPDGLTDDHDRLLASHLVRAAAVAADNLRLYEVEHSTALTLQRALLPDESPAVAGLDIATRYVASDARAEVGGDFYDVFEIDDDHVALIMGDVQGHSLEAASVMGDLRGSLRAYCFEGRDPATVVERANDLFGRFQPEMTATVWCSILERSTGRLAVANAGHLPALVLTPSGAWWLTGGCTLMGLVHHPPATTVFELPRGATLACATDGLVERPPRSIDEGLERMAVEARHVASTDVEAICESLLAGSLAARSEHTDDVALLVVHLRDMGVATDAPRVVAGTQMQVAPIAFDS